MNDAMTICGAFVARSGSGRGLSSLQQNGGYSHACRVALSHWHG